MYCRGSVLSVDTCLPEMCSKRPQVVSLDKEWEWATPELLRFGLAAIKMEIPCKPHQSAHSRPATHCLSIARTGFTYSVRQYISVQSWKPSRSIYRRAWLAWLKVVLNEKLAGSIQCWYCSSVWARTKHLDKLYAECALIVDSALTSASRNWWKGRQSPCFQFLKSQEAFVIFV